MVFGPSGGGSAPRMSHAVLAAVATLFLLYVLLTTYRTRLAQVEDTLDELYGHQGPAAS